MRYQALTLGGLASMSSEVLDEMLVKHPQAPFPLIPSDPVPTAVNISDEDVLRALKSFPAGSTPGLSSFRPTHFREAVLCPSPECVDRTLRALSGVVKHLCAGHAPLKWPNIFVALISLLARGREEVPHPSLWARFFVI